LPSPSPTTPSVSGYLCWRPPPNFGTLGVVEMSIELTVYLAREAMPVLSVWAQTVVDTGFLAELDSDFDVDTFTGFLPCRYDGADAGFEYASGPIEFVDGLELPSDFDFSVTFTTHSSPRELASSVVCAAVLCALGRGILVDPQADVAVSAEDAISWARDQLEELANLLNDGAA
jgi:hypothetical protein